MKTQKRAAHLITGERGENEAVAYLQAQSALIVTRNFRSPYGEIDVIIEDDGVLAFVEVRKRKAKAMVSAAQSITPQKMHKIRQSALVYLQHHPTTLPCRFDAVCIDGERLQWIKGAFV